MDLDRNLTFAYMMNKMGDGIVGSERSVRYVEAAYRAIA
jgi:hypothetical protein